MTTYRRGLEPKNGSWVWQKVWHFNDACGIFQTETSPPGKTRRTTALYAPDAELAARPKSGLKPFSGFDLMPALLLRAQRCVTLSVGTQENHYVHVSRPACA